MPLVPHMGAAAVVDAVSNSKGDLGPVASSRDLRRQVQWWTALGLTPRQDHRPPAPFIERADHPAALPVFIISRAAANAVRQKPRFGAYACPAGPAQAAQTLAAMTDYLAVPDALLTCARCW